MPRAAACSNHVNCSLTQCVETLIWNPQGLWKNGKPEGPGRYRWVNGNEYDGEWRAGRMHGQGTLKWASGVHHRRCCMPAAVHLRVHLHAHNHWSPERALLLSVRRPI
jgi:hypothetical protein